MKHISVFTLFALLTIWAGLVFATGCCDTNTTNNFYETKSIYSGINREDLAEAVAKSAACGANFDFNTHRKQGAVHGSYFDGEAELCIEAAWRPSDSAVMWDVGVVPDEDADLILWRGGVTFEF